MLPSAGRCSIERLIAGPSPRRNSGKQRAPTHDRDRRLDQDQCGNGPRHVVLGLIEASPYNLPGRSPEFDDCAWLKPTIGLTNGGGDGFSIKAADGGRFVIDSRMFTQWRPAILDPTASQPLGPPGVQSHGPDFRSGSGPRDRMPFSENMVVI